jgi:hypothetical protein
MRRIILLFTAFIGICALHVLDYKIGNSNAIVAIPAKLSIIVLGSGLVIINYKPIL